MDRASRTQELSTLYVKNQVTYKNQTSNDALKTL